MMKEGTKRSLKISKKESNSDISSSGRQFTDAANEEGVVLAKLPVSPSQPRNDNAPSSPATSTASKRGPQPPQVEDLTSMSDDAKSAFQGVFKTFAGMDAQQLLGTNLKLFFDLVTIHFPQLLDDNIVAEAVAKWRDYAGKMIEHSRGSPSRNEQQIQKLVQSFGATYHDPIDFLDRFKQHLLSCARKFDVLRYYSPYLAICQSSGWGKSRLLKEVSKSLPVLYISFQDARSSGYPKRSESAIQYLGQNNWTELWQRLCVASKVLLQKKKAAAANSDAAAQPAGNQYDLFNQVEAATFWNEAATFWNNLSFQDREDWSMEDWVFVVFDEASKMLTMGDNLFLTARRQLIEGFQNQAKLFAIFTDTSSRLTNFTPQQKYCRSERVAAKGKIIYDPVVIDAYQDALLEESNMPNWKESDYITYLGRPLWRNHADLNVFTFAASKIAKGRDDTPSSKRAIILSRLGLFLNPVGSQTSDLVANHMATLVAVNNERSCFLATYVSEPVLAIGASQWWKDDEYMKLILQELQTALLQNVVLEVVRGEMVACIVILMVMDHLMEKSRNSPTCDWHSLGAFLQGLYHQVDPKRLRLLPEVKDSGAEAADGERPHTAAPAAATKEEDGNEGPSFNIPFNAKVCVTHFIQWRRDFVYEDLEILAKRRAGCIMKKNQDGADLLFPAWWNGRDNSTLWGAILIQVKNRVDWVNMSEVGYKICPSYVFTDARLKAIPFLAILFELRGCSAPSHPFMVVKLTRTVALKTKTDTSPEAPATQASHKGKINSAHGKGKAKNETTKSQASQKGESNKAATNKGGIERETPPMFEVSVVADSGTGTGFTKTRAEDPGFACYPMLRYRGVANFSIVESRGLGQELLALLDGDVDPLKWYKMNCEKSGRLEHSIGSLLDPGVARHSKSPNLKTEE